MKARKNNPWSEWLVGFPTLSTYDDSVIVRVRARTADQAVSTALRNKSTRMMVRLSTGQGDAWEARRVER